MSKKNPGHDKKTLSEQDLDTLIYVLDVWMTSNEGSRLYEDVERLSDELTRCDEVMIK